MSFNLATILTETTLAAPGAPVCRFGGNPTSYRELEESSNALAPALVKRGVKRGDRVIIFGDNTIEQVQQRAVATVNYALGPGINLDGEVGYTWRDRDPESGLVETDDDYDGLELGIGTALSF